MRFLHEDLSSLSEEEELNPDVVTLAVFGILTFLVAVTMGFELLKEMALERSGKEFEPVVEMLFSELTVLGFLGVVVFCLAQADVLNLLSSEIFGEEEDDKLTEMLEFIHYMLFLIMVFFCMQTFALIQLGSHAEHDWAECNRVVLHEPVMAMLEDQLREVGRPSIFRPRLRAEYDANVFCFVFRALREELIQGRSMVPPFGRFPKHKQLPATFDYSRYLTHCATELMEGVVEVPIDTWLFLWCFLFAFFSVTLLVGSNQEILMWVFLGSGFFMAFFLQAFHRKVYDVLLALCDPATIPDFVLSREESRNQTLVHKVQHRVGETRLRLRRMSLHPSKMAAGDSAERTRLVNSSPNDYHSAAAAGGGNGEGLRSMNNNNSSSNSSLPSPLLPSGSSPSPLGGGFGFGASSSSPVGAYSANPSPIGDAMNAPTPTPLSGPRWISFELPKERSWLVATLCGSRPNRQHLLYWFQQNGPAFNVFMFRSVMLLQAAYLAVLLLHFVGVAADSGRGAAFPYLYFALGVVPLLMNYVRFPMLLRRVAHINSACSLRKPDVIAKVIREQKTMKAVRVMLLHHRLRTRLAGEAVSAAPTPTPPSQPGQQRKNNVWNVLRRKPGASAATHKGVDERAAFWNFKRGNDDATGESQKFTLESISEKIVALNLPTDQLMEIKRLFYMYDTDKSGHLDRDELAGLMASMGRPITDVEGEAIITSIDLDGDGVVSCDEFVAWYAEQLHSVPKDDTVGLSDALVEALFSRFDMDGSGSVTIFEFKEGMDKLNVGLSEEEIMDLVRELDEDNDGNISVEEFRQMFHRLAAQVNLLEQSKYESRRGLLKESKKRDVLKMVQSARRGSVLDSSALIAEAALKAEKMGIANREEAVVALMGPALDEAEAKLEEEEEKVAK